MTWEKTSEALFIHNYIKELGALRAGGRCTIRSYTIKACRDALHHWLLLAGAEKAEMQCAGHPCQGQTSLSPVPCASLRLHCAEEL